jgi:hypothetical protein
MSTSKSSVKLVRGGEGGVGGRMSEIWKMYFYSVFHPVGAHLLFALIFAPYK